VAGIVRLGTHLPFGQVPPLLAHFTGVHVDPETVRRLTEAAGTAEEALQTTAVATIERTLPPPAAGPAVQLLSVDGVMVPLVGGTWAEVKTLAIGAIPPAPDPAPGDDPAPGRVSGLTYFARLAEVGAFSRLATAETQRRGTETAQTVVAVVDGAEWCQQVIDHQRADAVRILDFAHAVGHLADVAQALFGSGTAGASDWLGTQAHHLRHGKEEDVLAELLDRATDAPTETARQVVEQTYSYLGSRQGQICYQAFARAGYPIGSGCIESANKLVVEARLKGSGMHWQRANVNPLLALRTVVANGRWEASWPAIWSRLRQQSADQARQRRSARRPPAPPDPPAPAPPAVADRPRPGRAQLVVNGKPTKDHPWRRCSPFRAKR
jgi:hypothetical protein